MVHLSEILVENDGPVRIVTLNAPGRRNALTREMSAALVDVCDGIDGDSNAGAVVIRANGQSFCSGAHRVVLSKAGLDPAASCNVDALSAIYEAFTRVGHLAPPVVVAVRGDVVGAGVNLMLAADLRIVARTARIRTGFLDLGVHPGGGHFTLMARAAGRGSAAALSLFGESIDGDRAAEIGLAWEALAADQVEARSIALAARVGREPRLARAMAKSFREQLGPPGVSWPIALESERGLQMWSLRNTMRLQ